MYGGNPWRCDLWNRVCIMYLNASNSIFTLGMYRPMKKASMRPEADNLSHSLCTPWRFRRASLWQSPRDSGGPSRLFSLATHIFSMGLREPWTGHRAQWSCVSLSKKKIPLSQLQLQEFACLLSSAALCQPVISVRNLSPNLRPALSSLRGNLKIRE